MKVAHSVQHNGGYGIEHFDYSPRPHHVRLLLLLPKLRSGDHFIHTANQNHSASDIHLGSPERNQDGQHDAGA